MTHNFIFSDQFVMPDASSNLYANSYLLQPGSSTATNQVMIFYRQRRNQTKNTWVFIKDWTLPLEVVQERTILSPSPTRRRKNLFRSRARATVKSSLVPESYAAVHNASTLLWRPMRSMQTAMPHSRITALLLLTRSTQGLPSLTRLMPMTYKNLRTGKMHVISVQELLV